MIAALALFACKPVIPETPTDGPPTGDSVLLGIGVAPRDPIAQVGETVEFFATAYYENTSYENVTGEVTWTVSDDRVARLDGDGVVMALAEGTTEILATDASGKGNSVTLTVIDDEASLDEIEVRPSSASINVGDTVQLSAHATYSDGSTGTLGAACRWESDDDTIATVDPAGRVTGASAGSTEVTASCSDYTGGATITVVEEDVDLGEADLVPVGASVSANGTDVVWTLQIRNDGQAASAGFYVDAYIDGMPSQPGLDYADTQWIDAIQPGEAIDVQLEAYDNRVDSFETYVIVDPENNVAESDETNNTAGPLSVTTVEPALGPDIIVDYFFAYTDGVTTEYLVEIHNGGDTASPTFWIDLHLDRVDAPTSCNDYGDEYVEVPALAPAEVFTWDPIVNTAPATGASWTSWAAVDICDDVGDADPSGQVVTYVVEQ